MAKKNSLNFTEDFFRSKGFVPDGKGGWNPPPIKSAYISSLGRQSDKENINEVLKSIPVGHIIPKEKVNNTPDFQIKPVTEWFIPYQIPSKKNSRQTFPHPKTGKMVNIPSKSYLEYKNVTKMYWTAFGKEFQSTIQKLGLSYPLNIEMTFIRKTNQLVDYFGPGESVFDLMTDFSWWPDDNRFYGKPFFGDMEVDKNNPGTRIKILLK